MARIYALFFVITVALAPAVTAADIRSRAGDEVDLQLVLAADNSGSMGTSLREEQRRGFASAFRDLALQRAVMSGPVGRIAVTYFEWADIDDQQVIVPWTVLATPEDMERLAKTLETRHISLRGGETSISGAMAFARRLFQQSGFVSYRRVVDISGNGRNSQGPAIAAALQALRESGTTVNGLVLPDSDSAGQAGPYHALFAGYDGPLVDYYRSEVIGGPGAFAMEVDPGDGFGKAILRKLVTEIAWVEPARASR